MIRQVPECLLAVILALLLNVAPGCAHTEYLAGFIQAPEPPAEQTTQLLVLDGEHITLEGDLAAELSRIPGAQVKLWGDLHGRSPKRRLEVTEYQILDAGHGVPPHVGTLRWDSGRLLLLEGPGRPIVELIGEQAVDLCAHVGAKVWVVGLIRDQEKLEVRQSGLLKPAASR